MIFVCPLCLHGDTVFYSKDRFRNYHLCSRCALIFVPFGFHVSQQEERERYNLHNNDPDNPGYRKFLNQLAQPLIKFLKKPSSGIDFGSGPNPALSKLLEAEGYQMSNFDPFFANNRNFFSQNFDFLTSCEVIEHFRNPLKEWEKMVMMVKQNGLIAISTETFNEEISFDTWYYKSDKTHVCFYSEKTFVWIAGNFNLKKIYENSPVRIFEKL